MNTSLKKTLRWLPATLCMGCWAHAQDPKTPATTSDYDDLDWPQVFETSDGFEVAIHQPQIHEWTDFRHVTARSAVAVKPKGAADDKVSYGALTVEADTTVDKEERVVFFSA